MQQAEVIKPNHVGRCNGLACVFKALDFRWSGPHLSPCQGHRDAFLENTTSSLMLRKPDIRTSLISHGSNADFLFLTYIETS